MNALTIFYDPKCGLCLTFKQWITAQAAYITLHFVPYSSPLAYDLCPGIETMKADEDIVILSDQGEIWQGPTAWITCLWALREYRAWSFRLATPTLLPLVRKAVHLISQNRLKLSTLFQLKIEDQAAQAIRNTSLECDNGQCRFS